jgi:hypothetical protein
MQVPESHSHQQMEEAGPDFLLQQWREDGPADTLILDF